MQANIPLSLTYVAKVKWGENIFLNVGVKSNYPP